MAFPLVFLLLMLFSLCAYGSSYAHEEETTALSETTSPTTPSSDPSPGLTNPQTAKIFDLADYYRLAVSQMKSGPFGMTSMVTPFQDGSMLTPSNSFSDRGWTAVISEIAHTAGQILGGANTTHVPLAKGLGPFNEGPPQHKKIVLGFKIISW